MVRERTLYDRKRQRKYLNARERQLFIDELRKLKKPRKKALLLTLLFTGVRISEALDLRVKDIDFNDGCLVFETLLGQITTQDALLLISIAEKEPKSRYILVLKVIRSQFNIPDFGGSVTFNHIHLRKLGLIKQTEHIWHLTTTGHEFMRCVGGFDE